MGKIKVMTVFGTRPEAIKMAPLVKELKSRPEIEHLIDELLTLDTHYFCPHGRPVIVAMSKYEIEKKFKRIV